MPNQHIYRPIGGDWNNYEGAPANQVLKGRLAVKGYTWEHRNETSIFPPLLSTLLSGINALIFGSVVNSFIFGRFLWNFLAAILLYSFLYLITEDSFLSSVGTVFASVCAVQTQFGSQVKALFKNFGNYKEALASLINILPNENFDYISINLIFFLLAMIIFYLVLKNTKKLYLVITGIIGGSLFYTLPYYWTTFCGAILLAIIYFLIKRDFYRSISFALVLGLMLIVGLPWLMDYHSWKMSPAAFDFSKSHAYFYGRNIDPLSVAYLFFLISITYILKNKKMANFQAIFFLLLSAILCRHIQVITGYTIYPSGWTVKVADILINILLIYLVYCLINHNYKRIIFLKKVDSFISKYHKPIGIFLVSVIFILSFWHQLNISFDHNVYANQIFPAGYFETYQWLDRNTEKDSTVLTLFSKANDDLITMTHNFPYCGFFNYNLYTVAEKERLERFYIACKLVGVENKTFRDFLELSDGVHTHGGERERRKLDRDLVSSEASGLPISLFVWKYKWYKPFYNYNFERYKHIFKKGIIERVEGGEVVTYIPEDVKSQFANDYSNYTNDTATLIKKYRLDYVLVGPFEKQIGSVKGLEENDFFKIVYENEFVKVFKVKK